MTEHDDEVLAAARWRILEAIYEPGLRESFGGQEFISTSVLETILAAELRSERPSS